MADGASITIDVDDAAVRDVLVRVAAVGGETKSLMTDFGAALLFATQRRFETRRAPGGAAWTRLAPRTARERIRLGYGTTNILRRTGILYASLTYVSTDTEAEVGTNNRYAAIQQFGGTVKHAAREATFRWADEGAATTKDGKRVGSKLRFASEGVDTHTRVIAAYEVTIPARPYLGIDADDVAELTAIGEDWIAERIGAAR